ncbi:MAG: lipoate--protein ligase [Bacteroidales bacterium]|nr:lipoate--protein ligase [Bacteroidales bacterium]
MKTLIQNSLDPFFNMAFDSYVLEKTDFKGFYLWQDKPSVIVGLNQSVYAEVNLPFIQSHGIELVRRVSGGGAVYHDLGNLCYTFVGYEDGPARVADALRRMGVPAELTGRNDIMVDGRKCSGYAKRLAAGRTMVHGTLMFDVNLEDLMNALAVPGSKLSAAGIKSVRSKVANLKEYLHYNTIEEFKEALAASLSGMTHPSFAGLTGESLNESQIAEIEAIATKQFRSWDWVYGHSPKTDFSCTKKFACGTVTAKYTLKHGRFTEVAFEGDFIGSKPASELAKQLIGLRPDELAGIPVGQYFDGMSKDDFIELFA